MLLHAFSDALLFVLEQEQKKLLLQQLADVEAQEAAASGGVNTPPQTGRKASHEASDQTRTQTGQRATAQQAAVGSMPHPTPVPKQRPVPKQP